MNIHENECLQAIWPTGDGERGTYWNQRWVTNDAVQCTCRSVQCTCRFIQYTCRSVHVDLYNVHVNFDKWMAVFVYIYIVSTTWLVDIYLCKYGWIIGVKQCCC